MTTQINTVPVINNRYKINKKIKIVGENVEVFFENKIKEIDVSFEEIKADEFEDRNIFLLNLIKEKYGKINEERHFIEWEKGIEIIGIRLNINTKDFLIKFHLVESKTIFKEVSGNPNEINLNIGTIDSVEKFNFVRNRFYELIKSYKKGFKHEMGVISVGKIFAFENNYTLTTSNELDRDGVDFMLKDNFFGTEFYFQIKSSWGYVNDAKERGRGYYNNKEIIFIVVYNKMKDHDFYSIISAEIKKSKKNIKKEN